MVLGFLFLLLIVGCSALTKCRNDTDVFLQELQQENPKAFAVTMYDSYGKMGSNVKGGNINQPGLMSECRSAHATSFSGQYCKVFLKQGEFLYFVGICVPDSCKDTDVNMLVIEGRLKFGEVSLIPLLPSILVNNSTKDVVKTSCLSSVIDPDASGITCLVLCCILVALPLVATLTTAVLNEHMRRKLLSAEKAPPLDKEQIHGDCILNDSSNSELILCSLHQDNHKQKKKGFVRHCLQQFLQAFSLQTTSKGIFSSPVKNNYTSLNGIRALSVLWIIYGHTLETLPFYYIDNSTRFFASLKTNPPLYTLAVDSFLLLGGLLSARSLLNSIQRNDDTMSVALVADYFFKRIRRIQPLHMFIILLHVGVFSVFNEGPYGLELRQKEIKCDTWWTNLLMINNLFPTILTCLPWTWYIPLDMQCYATTPLLILAYRKKKVVFYFLCVGLLMMVIVTGTVVIFLCRSMEDYVGLYYVKPYSRYGPFLIGIMFGMYLKIRKEMLLKKQWQVALAWICSLSVLALMLGLRFVFIHVPQHPPVARYIYEGLQRPVWAMALSLVILACEEGCGGLIMSFLSLKVWVPISNLSYSCYLVNSFVMLIYYFLQETPIHFLEFNFMYLYFGHVVLSIVLAYVLTVLVEKPFALLKWK